MLFLVSGIENFWRELLLMICEPIYWLIVRLYELFEVVGTADIITNESISSIYNRIGMLLGVYMMFRIVFSFIQMLINPDYITDKEKGIGNIVKKAILVVVLLAITPFVFTKAFELQNFVVGVETKDNVIAKLIFPDKIVASENFGMALSYYLFENFFRYNDLVPEANRDCPVFLPGNGQTLLYQSMYLTNGSIAGAKMCIVEDNVNNFNPIFSEEKTNIEYYKIDFTWNGVFAIIVGVVVCYVLLMYTLMVGARVIQLAFLRMIAPMAILGYLSPKKDGMFEKWLKMCVTTYIDLFIRMAIIFFVVFIIDTIIGSGGNGVVLAKPYDHMWIVNIVMILALLLFAKKAPELLKELFPKSGAASLGFGLKSPKKMFDSMLGGNILSKGYDKVKGFGKSFAKGAVGFGVGSFIGGAGNAIRGAINDKDNRARGFFGGLAGGAFSGGLAGAKAKGFLKSFGASNKSAKDQSKRIADWRAEGGESSRERWISAAQQKFGVTTTAKRLDLEKAALEAENSTYKVYDGYIDAAEKRAESQILKGAFVGNEHADNALRQKQMADVYRQQSANVKFSDYTSDSSKKSYYSELNSIFGIDINSNEFKTLNSTTGQYEFDEVKFNNKLNTCIAGNSDYEYLASFEQYANKNYEDDLRFYADKASQADTAYLNEMKAAKKAYISTQIGLENGTADTSKLPNFKKDDVVMQNLGQAVAVVEANASNKNYAFIDAAGNHVDKIDWKNPSANVNYDTFDDINNNAKSRQTENNNRLVTNQSEGKAARANDKYSGSGKS